MNKQRETVILHLVSIPHPAPIPNRLRVVLKRLLRQHGFRCIRIEGDALLVPIVQAKDRDSGKA